MANILVLAKDPMTLKKLQDLSKTLQSYQFTFTKEKSELQQSSYHVLLADEEHIEYVLHANIPNDIPILLLQSTQKSYQNCDVHDKLDMTKITSSGLERAIQSAVKQYEILHELNEQKQLLNELLKKLSIQSSGPQTSQRHENHASLHHLIQKNKDLLKEAHERSTTLHDIAKHDLLTQLPNRLYFNEKLHKALISAEKNQNLLSVFLIDLGKFKLVNDTYGHHTGDLLLLEVAKLLIKASRESDFVARIGGDEFAIIASEIETTHSSGIVAWKILHEIDKPFCIEGKKIFIEASIGITSYPMFGDSERSLLESADAAMYQAKKAAGSQYCYATAELKRSHSYWIAMNRHLKNALEHHEFSLVYQPIYQLISKKLYGFEILLRWHNEKLGDVPPLHFLPVAEKTGMMKAINHWIITTACEHIAGFKKTCSQHYKFSINLSPAELKQPNLRNTVHTALEKYGLNSDCLQFEISEMTSLYHHKEISKTIYDLDHLGISHALDNFGTGRSAMNDIRHLPIKVIKIDRTFTAEINKSHVNDEIIEGLIALAKNLDMSVIAEGIETVEQLNYLLSKECPLGQGFYFSKPLTTEQVTTLLEKNKSS